MVAKKKQKSTATKKKSKTTPKVNPFELKFNRLKHNVLGKKKNVGGVGHPGQSRKRAHEQREKTLGVEYERVGKVNKIVDRRIGEKNKSITSEEKASMRFTAERVKHLKKGSKFNLGDDDDAEELLTHGGRVLTDIQKYDKIMGSDDDDDDPGTIGADVVKVAHFGGGDLEPSAKPDAKLSRKDVIADLIAKTRHAREEKHIAKDEMETATEELDAKYLKLLDKVKAVFRPVGATKSEKTERDDYDKLAIGLKIDADTRATPAERTKTEEELAIEERLRLEEMESLRVARMNAESNKKGHRSVDADTTEQKPSKKSQKQGFEVRFDSDGKLLNAGMVEPVSKKKVAVDSDEELTDEEVEDENEEELDDLISEHHDDEGSEGGEEEGEEENDSDDADEDGDDDGDDNEDGGMDEEEDDEEDDNIEDEEEHQIDGTQEVEKKTKTSSERNPPAVEDTDVPFVFEMPKKYDALAELLIRYPPGKAHVVLERLMKCYHPSLAEGNKRLLSKLFLYVLRFYDDTAASPLSSDSLKLLGLLSKSLYSLMKFDIEFSVRCVRALIRQNWKKRINKPKSPTPFSLIALLRLISCLYPVSDRWHPVCSPAMALAALMLAKCRISNLNVLARQILLVTVISDYVEESRRFVPEAIAFCQGALLMAVENEDTESPPTTAFPVSLPHRKMLYIREELQKDVQVKPLEIPELFNNDANSDDSDLMRCRVLRALVAVVQKYRILYAAHEHTFTATFTPFVSLLKRIPTSRLPSAVAEEVEALTCSTEAECKLRARLTQMSRVVTEKSMLKMLEPRFEENFDPERPRMNRDQKRQGAKAEKEKLRYLVKKETRGAIKELRKDSAFLMRKQRKETAMKDRDRREKTKRLMSGLQSQQGEWNKELFESGKKKKK
ncbi:hypothetical protein Q1695_014153 [Nippostrongylus brasiliensis]|nr:hypothetical protein Q1695_014153 [Nippostrongylus brasiliensis]